MHIERIIQEFKNEVVQLRADIGIATQLAEIREDLDEIKELVAANRELKQQAEEIAAGLREENARLKAAQS